MGGTAVGEEEAEVGVRGNEHPILVERSLEDDVVPRCSEVEVSSVDDVVAGSAKLVRKERRGVLVDQEPHAGWRRGSCRSLRASAA